MLHADFVEILADVLFLDPEEIEPEAVLVDELGMQSIDVMMLLEELEQRLGRSLGSPDFSQVETVSQLQALLLPEALAA